MEDLEHILRFFTLFENWKNIGNVLSVEMDEYMSNNRKASQEKITSLRTLFNQTIEACNTLWGNYSFNKPVLDTWREQLISPLYDAEMVAVALLINENKISSVLSKQQEILAGTRGLYEGDPVFNKAVSQATNNPSNIKVRINKMYNMINQISDR